MNENIFTRKFLTKILRTELIWYVMHILLYASTVYYIHTYTAMHIELIVIVSPMILFSL